MSGRRGHLLVEDLSNGDGFVARRAGAADPDALHEGGALVAALLAECSGPAVAALVDGDGPAGPVGGDDHGPFLSVSPAAVGGSSAGVGAEASSSAGGERLLADRAADRDAIVT